MITTVIQTNKNHAFLLSFVLLIVVSVVVHESQQLSRSPVVLIPGYSGSRLEAKLDDGTVARPHWYCLPRPLLQRWFTIWVNLAKMRPSQLDCWSSMFRLGPYNRKLKIAHDIGNVQIRPYLFGSTKSVSNLESMLALPFTRYFEPLIVALERELKYERDHDIVAAPYDFRRAPDELRQSLFVPLRRLVEISVHGNDNKPATLICHSMGCALSLLFLDQQTDEWRQKYVRRLVTLAGSFAGTIDAVVETILGTSFNLPNEIVDPLIVRKTWRTFPSITFRYPAWTTDRDFVVTADINRMSANPRYTNSSGSGSGSDLGNSYGQHNIEKLFDRLNLTDFRPMYSNGHQWAKRAADTTPKVESWCLHSHSVPTTIQVRATDQSFEQLETLGKKIDINQND